MDTKSLRYFLAVAQERNITKAANKLCMAQPPLSRQMKLLEEELGVQLFIRGSRRLQLTEEGYYLKQQAEEILMLMEKTEHRLEKMGEQDYGTVSIGATEACGGSILTQIIGEFCRQAPNVKYQLWTGNGVEMQDRLERNLIDLAIIREPFNMENYDRVFLYREPWIVVMSKEHRLACGSEIDLSMLQQESLMIPSRPTIQNEINNWFNEISSERNIFCLYNAITSVVGLAEQNLGLIICPESALNFIKTDKLTSRKIVRPLRESGIYLVKKHFQVMTTAAERFWKFASEYPNAISHE